MVTIISLGALAIILLRQEQNITALSETLMGVKQNLQILSKKFENNLQQIDIHSNELRNSSGTLHDMNQKVLAMSKQLKNTTENQYKMGIKLQEHRQNSTNIEHQLFLHANALNKSLELLSTIDGNIKLLIFKVRW